MKQRTSICTEFDPQNILDLHQARAQICKEQGDGPEYPGLRVYKLSHHWVYNVEMNCLGFTLYSPK